MLAKASIHRAVSASLAISAPSPTMETGLRQHDK
jgi:hypothetical protein